MATVRVFLTAGTTSWVVPADWVATGATIECIGPGGHGALPGVSNNGWGGGQGGGYGKVTSPANIAVGNTLVVQVGAAGSTNATFLKNNLSTTIAQGDYGASGAIAVGGARAQTNIGATATYAGGDGGDGRPATSGGGGGGGGAGGPNGAGAVGGSTAPASSRGNGGGGASGGQAGFVGDASLPGHGGHNSNGTGGGLRGATTGEDGGDGAPVLLYGGAGGGGGFGNGPGPGNGGGGAIGREWDLTHGAGGGGGGAGGSGAGTSGSDGGNAGNYGGGGGGAGNRASGVSGSRGAGAAGLIVITYSTGDAPGSAAGVGAAAGIGLALKAASGAAVGAGTTSGAGRATMAAVGAASGIGVATGFAPSFGTSAGVGTASAVGSAVKPASGTTAGVGAADGAGRSIHISDGLAAGGGAAFGVGQSEHAAVGTAAGVGDALSGAGEFLTEVTAYGLVPYENLTTISAGTAMELDYSGAPVITSGVGGTLRDEHGAPLIAGFAGPTPVALFEEYTPVAAPAKLPFYAVEIVAFQPNDNLLTVAPTAWGAVPWGALSLYPISRGTTVTILASDCGYRTLASDAGGVRAYPALITEGFEFVRRTTISPGEALAGASYGQIKLINHNGMWDSFRESFSVDGRPVTIYRGEKTWDDRRGIYMDPSHDDLVVVFTGVAANWELDGDSLEVTIRDATYWLERPYQQNRFGGTGGYDGNSEIAGVAVPRTRGGTLANPIRNVTPVRITGSDRVVYKFSDAPGRAVTVFEGAKPVFIDDGNVGNLFSTSPPAPGHMQRDDANAAFELPEEPQYAITCDVTGQFLTAGAVSIASSIARYIQTEDALLPIENIDLTSFSDAAAAYPYVSGLYFSPDDVADGVTASARALAGMFATLTTDRQGRQRCFVLRSIPDETPPTFTLTSANCIRLEPADLPDDMKPQPYRVGLAWQHNWTVQRSGLNPTASAEAVQFASSPDTVKTHINLSVSDKFARAGVIQPFGGSLLVGADAAEVLEDVGPFLTGDRRRYMATVPVSVGIGLDIGDVGRLVWRYAGLRNGRLCQIVGERFRRSDETITFEVLV